MEYKRSNGTKAIVEGDMVEYEGMRPRKQAIGVNYANGVSFGGYLSSFKDSFTEELIGIESGMGDIVKAKIGNIREAYELLKSKLEGKENINVFEISAIVLETVNEYFGGFKNLEQRMDYYYPEDFEESKDNKISNLKGKGSAMCVERAALAQNLLKSLGINSVYKASGIVKDEHKEAHCYNLIEYEGKYYIFDTSLPNLIDGVISPLIAEIDKETFDTLSTPLSDIGISVSVSHYNPYRNVDMSITYDSGRKKQIEVEPLRDQLKKEL